MTPPYDNQITVTFMSGPYDGRSHGWTIQNANTEVVLEIGRRDGSDITLDYDSQVSRLHARVIYDHANGRFFLEDAGSRNGTFIGVDRIRGRTEIARGQLFRIGRTWMRVDLPLRAPDPHPADSEPGNDLPRF